MTAAKKPAAGPVAYVSSAPRKRVYDSEGVQVAHFDEGRFETDDKAVQEILDGLPDVRRAES